MRNEPKKYDLLELVKSVTGQKTIKIKCKEVALKEFFDQIILEKKDLKKMLA